MTDNNQDRSQDQGQQGIDRETEQRNRENETGQQGGPSPSDQERGQEGGSSATGESAFGQPGQSAGGETTLAERTGQTEPPASTGLGSSTDTGFVGTNPDQSSDYLTKGEENQDFAPEGQGAQETSAGRSDVETGEARDRDAELDDGSDAGRSA